MIDTEPMVHVRFQGISHDITFGDLDIGEFSSDAEIKHSVASFLEVPVAKIENMRMDRNADTQDITFSPQAIFG